MLRLKKMLLVLAVINLTGCSAVNFGVEGLLNAPKLTKQQGEIHEALVKSVGSNITLKYPKNGDNRSAYVISNFDDEPGNEAIVFYEYNDTGKKEGLWANILDNNDDDEWVSVSEIPGAGSDISQVIISSIGENNEKNVIVGYQSIAGEEKALEVYRYDNGSFNSICSDNYSALEIIDINSDGANEMVLIRKNTENTNKYKAVILEMKNNELVESESIGMSENVISYVNSKTGRLEDNSQAIYLDCLTSENMLRTEILLYEDGKLRNPVTFDETVSSAGNRPSGYYSMDIDGDGKVEIPSVRPMLGYENAVEQDLEYMTTWSLYEKAEGIKAKFSGYYSVSDGYVMIFPNRWTDRVTVKKDTRSNDVVFYKYDGDINGKMTELMRVAAVSSADMQEYLSNNYQLIDRKGQLDYMVKLPAESEEPLVLTIDEIQNSFFIVG